MSLPRSLPPLSLSRWLPPFLLQPRIQLALIFLLAFALRLYGIEAGLPNPANPVSSYHPDEVPTLLQAQWFHDDSYRPQQFVYGGSLFFFVVSSFLKLGDLLSPVLDQYNLQANALLVARYVMVYVALVTMLLVYEAVRALYSENKALLATLVLALAPAHVVMAQQMRADEISALLTALQYLLATRIWQAASEKSARRLLWLSALVAGLMLSFRFPLVLFFAMPLMGWLLRDGADFWLVIWRRLLPATLPLCAVLIVAGYAVGSPYTFTQFPVFVAGMQLQWQFQSNPFADAVGMGPIPWQYWWGMLHQSLGYPFYFAALAGFFIMLRRRSAGDWLLLAGLLPYMVMVSLTSWVVVRYTLPLVPLLAIVVADTTWEAARRVPARVVQTVAVVACGLTLWAVLAFLRLGVIPNVRDLTRQWVETNVPPARCLVMVKAYNAEEMYNPSFTAARCLGTTRIDDKETDYTKVFAEQPIDYVLIHEHLYASMERLGAAHPAARHAHFYSALLGAGFTVVHEQEVRPVLLGVDFSSWFSSLDMTYTNPSFRIYQRTGTPTPAR